MESETVSTPPSPTPAVPTPPIVPSQPSEPIHKKHISTPLGIGIILLVLLLVGGGIYAFYTTQLKPPQNIDVPVMPTGVLERKPLPLEVTSPTDSDIILENQIQVKGKTEPDAAVVVYTDTESIMTQADSGGVFESSIALAPGINTVTVAAYDEKGQEKMIAMDIVYDNESSILGKSDSKTQKQPTVSVKKAEIGTVEKVAPNTMVLEKKANAVQVETEIGTYTKIVGQNKKILKIQNVKKYDKVAIITQNEESTSSGTASPSGKVQKNKKALVIFIQPATDSASLNSATSSSALKTGQLSKRMTAHGVVTANDGSNLTLVHQTQRDRITNVLIPPDVVVKYKSTYNATVADAIVGSRVIVLGRTNENGVLVAQRIFIIPGKAEGINKRYPVVTSTVKTATPSVTLSTSPTTTSSATLIPTEPVVTLSPTLPLEPSVTGL